GQIVGEVPAQFGLAPGVSMSFGPMPRRTADRLRQALAQLAPLAADGLAQESPPAGYVFEPPAPPAAPGPPAAAVSAHGARAQFDFGAGDLAPEGGDAHPAEDLRLELQRLKAEVRQREDRIATIEQTLRDRSK
ncbi:MAG: hypothetical protein H6Q89_422, partial [Myxococcaceae bacterium]|nr:hypothetical protein [Myxococcaceae bacterium]